MTSHELTSEAEAFLRTWLEVLLNPTHWSDVPLPWVLFGAATYIGVALFSLWLFISIMTAMVLSAYRLRERGAPWLVVIMSFGVPYFAVHLFLLVSPTFVLVYGAYLFGQLEIVNTPSERDMPSFVAMGGFLGLFITVWAHKQFQRMLRPFEDEDLETPAT